jgi:hypothetical protein
MPAKKKVKKLPSGELVILEPPDDKFPEGKMSLIPGPSPLKARLEADAEDKRARAEQLAVRNRSLLERKQNSLKSHPEVPASKRHV